MVNAVDDLRCFPPFQEGFDGGKKSLRASPTDASGEEAMYVYCTAKQLSTATRQPLLRKKELGDLFSTPISLCLSHRLAFFSFTIEMRSDKVRRKKKDFGTSSISSETNKCDLFFCQVSAQSLTPLQGLWPDPHPGVPKFLSLWGVELERRSKGTPIFVHLLQVFPSVSVVN